LKKGFHVPESPSAGPSAKTVRQSSDKDPTLSPPDGLSTAPPPAAALVPPTSPSHPLHRVSSCPAATEGHAKPWLASPDIRRVKRSYNLPYLQVRSKDSQVKTQLVLWIFILFEVTR